MRHGREGTSLPVAEPHLLPGDVRGWAVQASSCPRREPATRSSLAVYGDPAASQLLCQARACPDSRRFGLGEEVSETGGARRMCREGPFQSRRSFAPPTTGSSGQG